ncbi:MAG: hypothetical protein IIA55_15790 [Gemmatimonadetes bacterium]|nr:hypothetical protein [Gemmatimonadota bacterium]
MNDSLDRLASALSDRYTIERELGAGGMATVYLAEDLKHHRKVAVKVLRPELAAVIGAERFLKEIEVTANLQRAAVFRAGTPQLLFEGRYRVSVGGLNQNYDVAPDGQRFVMVRAAGESGPPQIRLVLNFFEELKAKVGN